MTVVRAEIKADGRQLKPSFTGVWVNGEAQIKTSGTITYQVWCDRPDEPPLSLLYSNMLPQLGATYSENGIQLRGLYYADASPRFIGPSGSRWIWEVAYTLNGEFSRESGGVGNQDGTGADDQDAVLLNFSLGVETEDYASPVDLDGAWNCNSIGEFFADPIMIKTAIVSFNYSRREYVNPLTKIDEYFQAHNATPWHGLAVGRVKVSEITFTASQTTSETTYDVNYKLQYRRRGWGEQKANTGYYYNAGGAVVRAMNEDGSPTDSPILLALDGSRLPSGADVPMKTFRTTNPKDLNALNLPNPFTL